MAGCQLTLNLKGSDYNRFSKAFDLVRHDWLLKKIAASGVDSRVVVLIREFLVGRCQRVKVKGKYSEEVMATSGVPQGSVLGPLLFITYVNDIWRNVQSKIKFYADDCTLYRKILNDKDMEKLQIDFDRLGEWVVENEGKKLHKSTGERAVKITVLGTKMFLKLTFANIWESLNEVI
jgi:retron-type reverse transcriptase